MTTKQLALAMLVALLCVTARADELGSDGYVNSDGVKIHYVTAGQGPLVVLIHGFPDFWYTWRNQMPALAKHFQVVAIDLRGYNLSDQPTGVDNYKMTKFVADVAAVVKHFQRDKATIVGHDVGGRIGWNFAMTHPEMTERLVILNVPHPKGFLRELANNPAQYRNSQYARNFQKDDAVTRVSAEGFARRYTDPAVRAKYLEAFGRSSLEGMLNHYKANYPREPYSWSEESVQFPPVKCPVLLIHGLKDTALLPAGLNDNWKWLENEFTLITIPTAGHWVQHDAADRVTIAMVNWLTQ